MRPSLVAAVCGFVACALPAVAQERAASGRNFDLTLTAEVGYTEIQGYEAGDRASGVVGRLNPGLRWRVNKDWLVGSVDYSLLATYYTRNAQANTVQNSLSAGFVAQAVRDFLFIDARASVTQQTVSVLGQPSIDGGFAPTGNREEVLSASVSPYIRTRLGSWADLELRYRVGTTTGRDTDAYDAVNSGSSIDLSSSNKAALLGWSLQASQQRVDFKGGRATETTRYQGVVSLRPDPELTFNLRAGQETTDVGSIVDYTQDTWGVGLRWQPSTRTRVSLDYDERYFGKSYSGVIEHRWRQVLVRFTAARDIYAGEFGGLGQPITLYALYFTQFASAVPDPVQREVVVREYLRSLGLDPNAVVSGGLLTNATTVQRRQDLAVIYTGQRTTVSLQVYTNGTRIIDNPLASSGDEPTRKQRGYSATMSYRLSPRSSLALSASGYKGLAGGADPGSNFVSYALTFNNSLTERATASLSARRSELSGLPAVSYRESSLTASLSLRY